MPTDGDGEWSLRPASRDDVADLTSIHLRARAAAPMPPGIHPEHEVGEFLRSRLDVDEIWVAASHDAVVGYARFTPTWLDGLYVLPAYQGQGIGTALLQLVASRLPEGFGLWVFETNLPAQRFYRRHGLRVVERTDGRDNEEREPDLRMVSDPRI